MSGPRGTEAPLRSAPIPADEQERQDALDSYLVLDTPPEEAFDRITRTAARLFDVPISLISLIDRDRQWFKSCVGIVGAETSRDEAFCAHAILGSDVMVVLDALSDPRFAGNPAVTGDPYIRFYAGAPLKTREGSSLGTLCIADRRPRPSFSEADRRALSDLAEMVVDLLELRLQALDLRSEIGRRMRAEEEVEQQRETVALLASIVRGSSDAVISKSLDGRITSWNHAAEEMYGYSAAEAIGRPVEMLIPPERAGEMDGVLATVREGRGVIELETERLTKDGRTIQVSLSVSPITDPSGEITAAATIARDISSKKRSEQELRASEAFKGAILSSIAEGVVVTDAEDRIVLVNPAMEELGGWSQEEVQGRPMTDVYRPVDQRGEPVTAEHPRIAEFFHEREGAITSRGHSISLMTRIGVAVPVSWTLAWIRDASGNPQGRVAVLRDVTEEREVDEIKSSLVSTVSHELRTPLTMIQGFSELLIARDVGRDRSVEALSQIHSSAERLARLIDDLLSVSRIDAGNIGLELEAVHLRTLVGRVTADFSASGRELIVETEDRLPLVKVDSDKTCQILTNLISNAIKYSDEQTPVSVEIRRVDDEVELSVTDRGIGLSPEEQAQLFQKFFRADNSDVRKRPGTGLGLYITKNLVELQGGRMWVESERGRGSTFGFTVPITEDDRGSEGGAVES